MPRYQLPPGPGRPSKPPGEKKIPVSVAIDPRVNERWAAIARRFFAGSKVTTLEVCFARGMDVIEAERTEKDGPE